MKKTIIHVIDNLGQGGAETVLVALLKDFNNIYDIILVTLTEISDFSEVEVVYYKKYNLGFNSIRNLPSAILKLKKIIKDHKPAIVRTDLFWSTIIGRLATPGKIPFAFGVHSKLSQDAFNSSAAYWLERLTYNKNHSIIAVSEAVLEDYDRCIRIKGKKYVLHNFVNPLFFQQEYSYNHHESSVLKLVAVGNLKQAKNYEFLLKAVQMAKNFIPITLDIIGEGDLRNPLQEIINKNNLPVRLLGKKKNVYELLPHYNAYIMCSHYEGFGNAAAEAMTIGLPLILNDMDTMKEMSKNNALFYENDDVQSLVDLFCKILSQKVQLAALSEKGKLIAKEFYTKDKYLLQIQNIYQELSGI